MKQRYACWVCHWLKVWLWAGILALSSTPAYAAISAYEFQEPAQEQQFRSLVAELRCPKCQNQNIADSNAPLAQDLRQRVFEMVKAGQSNDEITQFMVARYGDFITYRPPVKPTTWVLWFGPFVIMGIVALLLALWIRRRGRQPATELTEQERQRLKDILASGEDNSR
jgi:cytochrome c-type biogenesis protein CcmH